MHADRWVAAAGLAAALLLVAGGIAGNVGVPPAVDAPPASVTAYYRQHAAAVALSGYLNVLAVLLVVGFAAGLRARLVRAAPGQPGAWETVATAGAVLLAATVLTVTAIQGALPLAAGSTADGGAVGALFSVWNVAVGLVGAAAAPLLVGGSVAAHRAGLIGRWLTAVGVVGGAAGLLGGVPVGVWFPRSPVHGLVSAVAMVQYPALFAWLTGMAWRVMNAADAHSPRVRADPATERYGS